jgi:hypothetical protein
MDRAIGRSIGRCLFRIIVMKRTLCVCTLREAKDVVTHLVVSETIVQLLSVKSASFGESVPRVMYINVVA